MKSHTIPIQARHVLVESVRHFLLTRTVEKWLLINYLQKCIYCDFSRNLSIYLINDKYGLKIKFCLNDFLKTNRKNTQFIFFPTQRDNLINTIFLRISANFFSWWISHMFSELNLTPSIQKYIVNFNHAKVATFESEYKYIQ